MRAKGHGETANYTSKPCPEILAVSASHLEHKTQTSLSTKRDEKKKYVMLLITEDQLWIISSSYLTSR